MTTTTKPAQQPIRHSAPMQQQWPVLLRDGSTIIVRPVTTGGLPDLTRAAIERRPATGGPASDAKAPPIIVDLAALAPELVHLPRANQADARAILTYTLANRYHTATGLLTAASHCALPVLHQDAGVPA